VRATPFAFAFLLLLAAATGLYDGATADTQRRLLEGSSTNLAHLGHEPLRVLLASVLWVSPGGYLTEVLPAALLLAVVERRVGTARTALVFVSGHVGASLLTAAGIWAGIRAGSLPGSLADTVDVGVSYGTFAVAAYATGLLRGWPRAVGAGALALTIAHGAAVDRTFTDFGHLFAFGIGLAFALDGLGLPRRRRRSSLLLLACLALAAPSAGFVELPAGNATIEVGHGRAEHIAQGRPAECTGTAGGCAHRRDARGPRNHASGPRRLAGAHR
jgi:hypothetical protein